MAITGVYCDGYEHQTLSSAGSGLFTAFTNAAIVTTAGVPRTGAACLRCTPTTSATGRANTNIPGTAQAKRIARFYWRYAALPASGTFAGIFYFGFFRGLLRVASDGTIQSSSAVAADFLTNAASPVLAADTWHLIEVQLDTSVATYPMALRVNGALVGNFVSSTAQNATTIGSYNLGENSTTGGGGDFSYDDVVIGTYTDAATDWFGDGSVVGLLPDSDRAHNVGTTTFRYTDNNGAAYTTITNATTVANERLRDWPVIADANAADNWVDRSSGTSLANYVQFDFDNPTPTTIPQCFTVAVAIKTTSTTANNATITPINGADALYPTAVHAATIGSAATAYKAMGYGANQAGGALALADITDLGLRFASSDVAPIPQFKAAIVQVAFPDAVASGAALIRTVAATVAHTGDVARATTATRAATVAATMTTTAARLAARTRTLAATAPHTAVVTGTAGVAPQALTRSLAWSGTATIATARLYAATRARSATIAHTSTTTRAGAFARAQSTTDAHTATVALAAAAIARPLAATNAHTASTTRGGTFSRPLAATSGHTATVARAGAFSRAQTSTRAHTATTTRAAATARTLTATNAHTATTARAGAFSRPIATTGAHTATLVRRLAALRAATWAGAHAAAITGTFGSGSATATTRVLAATTSHAVATTRALVAMRALTATNAHTATTLRAKAATRAQAAIATHTSTAARSLVRVRTATWAGAHTATSTRRTTATRTLAAAWGHAALVAYTRPLAPYLTATPGGFGGTNSAPGGVGGGTVAPGGVGNTIAPGGFAGVATTPGGRRG